MAPLPGAASGDNVPKELERGKVLDETKWLVYCCCEGVGLGPVGNPCIAAESKQLCIRSSVTTTDVMGEDGLCGGVSILLCLTQQGQCPPLEGPQACTCFNMKCGKPMGSTKWKGTLFQEDAIMNNTFWLYYFICSGVGFNKMDQGLYGQEFKELCCRGYTVIEPPVIDGVFCSSVGTELCFWSECQMPPAQKNPKIACCTWRMSKDLWHG